MFGIDEMLFLLSDQNYTPNITATEEALVRRPPRDISEELDVEEC